jgi:hypothetical protein
MNRLTSPVSSVRESFAYFTPLFKLAACRSYASQQSFPPWAAAGLATDPAMLAIINGGQTR